MGGSMLITTTSSMTYVSCYTEFCVGIPLCNSQRHRDMGRLAFPRKKLVT